MPIWSTFSYLSRRSTSRSDSRSACPTVSAAPALAPDASSASPAIPCARRTTFEVCPAIRALRAGLSVPSGVRRAAAPLEEIENFLPIGVVVRVLEHRLAAPRPRQVHRHDLADARVRAVRHHHDTVGEQER